MDHYMDIDVRSDPDFAPSQLLSALYSKLHRVLVAQGRTDIGVSFPGFELKAPHLGMCLRLHGSLLSLSALEDGAWLIGMRDHVVLTPPTPIPDVATYRTVKRVQVKSNPERLRRRLMRRHNLDEQEARQRLPDESARFLSLPYFQLRSTSTGQNFRLFIEHGPTQPDAVAGEFNAYGLSHGATIAWF